MYKKTLSPIVLLLVLCIFAQPAIAARFTVSGKVAYHDPNMAQGPGVNDDLVGIPDAVITFLPAGFNPPWDPITTYSDENGDYEITFTAREEEGFYYNVSCSAEGYDFDQAVVYEEDTELFFIALQ
jgi:hypothetical protein